MARGRLTFGQVETRIRRDLLNDNDQEAYRWGVHQVMAAMNIAVVDIVKRYNQWAGYDQETGRRIYDVHTRDIEDRCVLEPVSQSAKSDDGDDVGTLRALKVPIDDRYADAIACLSAGRLLMLDDADTENAQKAQVFIEQGREYAQR